MKNIWAPWRIDYIKGGGKGGCFLCRAVKSRDDAANLVLLRRKRAFVIMNRYPYNSGHLMVALNRHEGDIEKIGDAALAEMMKTTVAAKAVLRRIMKPDGFNIGVNLGKAAGAGVERHIHIHIVPRWAGDTNFMPVLADARVVPEALDKLYGVLKAEFDKAGKGNG